MAKPNDPLGPVTSDQAVMLPFAVDAILDNSVTDFDLYAKAGVGMTLYAAAPYRWDLEELRRLLADGHKDLYYHPSNAGRVQAYRRIISLAPVNLAAPPAQRIVNLTEAAAELTRILYDHRLTPAFLAKGSEIASAMVDCVREDRACVSALQKLASHDFYTYYHSARVAAYALAIAMHLSARDEALLEQMAVGCLFHDIGKSRIDLGVINKPGVLNDGEMALMRKHPEYGYELVQDSQLGHVPREIILHHHERLDGKGYPHGIGDAELLEEVKIAAFADVFDALTTNRPYQKSRSRFEALDFIRFKLLKTLHADAFKAMVEILQEDHDEATQPSSEAPAGTQASTQETKKA